MRNLARFIATISLLLPVWGCGDVKDRSPEKVGGEAAIAAPARPEVDNRPVIVALGDSLTVGLGVKEEDNYPFQLQRLLNSAGYSYRVVNAGVSGDTTAQGLQRLDSVIALHPSIVILELGANDGLRGLPTGQTRANLDEIIRRLRAAGAKVVLAGMEVPPNYGPAYTQGFRTQFQELAREYKLSLIPFFLAGVGGIAELNQEDGIHPTAKGYAKVTENAWKALEPLLQRATRRN